MQEFFNPAGLEISEDRSGAIAYGFIAPRVFYARFVGNLSATLAYDYVARLGKLVEGVPSLAYFADASAMTGYDYLGKARFQSFVQAQRLKLATLVILTWAGGLTPSVRHFAASVGEPIVLLDDPSEFDRLLANLVPAIPPLILLGELRELHQPLDAR
jgi:hypothetical protein